MSGRYADLINYHIVPPVFLVLFTALAQYLAAAGNPEKPFQFWFLYGNAFAWKVIGGMLLWAFIWLWVPSKKFYGPTTSFGLSPKYSANGELYYFATLAGFGTIAFLKPYFCVLIYENMGPILGGLNILALSLCLYLLVSAKLKKNENDPYLLKGKYPILHEFYRGMELHPRIFGVDIKQLTNCRMGMMIWQLLILIYFVAACQLKGFDSGHLVNASLQTIYIYKFFRWETGYFNTLDITLDRAGYYLCWGCLVWVPSFYTFHSYFFVYYQPNCGQTVSTVIFLLGLAAIYFNYDVDRQKEQLRTGKASRETKTIKVSYVTTSGAKRDSQLLISGWWGVARKINYTFEMMAAFMWSVPGGLQFGIWPFLYLMFLTILLIHRIFRDEQKCQEKYGRGWSDYCKKVPYRLIPYVF